jgi:NAD(P)H-hydrate repair Nnr-like enzyme with NAD(P)H-hydrate dehydratase domain
VQADRLEAATRLAERYGCVALLKGSGSIVAAPGRTPYLNPTGNAALATAGTGDVLAGWIAGRWAQAHEGDSIEAAQRIAAQAAFRHGLAADRHGDGDTPLRAADLVERMLEIG